LGFQPSRSSFFTATAIVTVMLSMSSAPRPQISPSMRSPQNGSRFQPFGSAGTTSM